MLNLFYSLFSSPLILCILPPLLYLLKKYFNGPMCTLNPDLTNKVAIVTGSNTGIGKYTALGLAKLGAQVILACRDLKKAEETKNEIQMRTGNNKVLVMELDLADLESVRKFAKNFLEKFQSLDILINNAGVMAFLQRRLTKQGYEMQFGTNHLGHFLLTTLLLDCLKKTNKSRIINVASLAHHYARCDFDDIKSEKYYGSNAAYGRSKLANILFTRQLAKQFEKENLKIKAVALHPGVVITELTRNVEENLFIRLLVKIGRPIRYLFFKDTEHGAQTSLNCALLDWEKLENGGYYSDCKLKGTSYQAKNEKLMNEVWEISEKAVRI
jgi:retinol dehydrogenase-12